MVAERYKRDYECECAFECAKKEEFLLFRLIFAATSLSSILMITYAHFNFISCLSRRDYLLFIYLFYLCRAKEH
ncbi:hypothetical protein BpHYR1_031926 [Brachionus plicatilis]|uniref:Uncharacterized protein n=1 Tax=Brachionus plicatilis TaxID=10195 RepID=A0A3M7SEN4_BRAPC|nr:hypothetical protein BpHYR1_031926 [Brachionus plicatilis]